LGSVYSRGLIARVALGAAAALGLSVLATSGIGSKGAAATGDGSPTNRARPDVVVIGESLVAQVAPLEQQLLQHHGYRAAVVSRDSKALDSRFVQAQIRRAVAEGTPIVVLETAANDAVEGAGTAPPSEWAPALARYQRTLAATLAALSHQCTVLVDTRVTGTSKWYAIDRIGPGINRAIADAARRHPRSVEAVQWSAKSAGHGVDWFWTDGLHFGDPAHSNADWHDAGATAFTGAIASGVDHCATDRHVVGQASNH
jgi:hypothetical protein